MKFPWNKFKNSKKERTIKSSNQIMLYIDLPSLTVEAVLPWTSFKFQLSTRKSQTSKGIILTPGCRHLPEPYRWTRPSRASRVREHELWLFTSCQGPKMRWLPTFAATSRSPCLDYCFNEQSQMVPGEFTSQQELLSCAIRLNFSLKKHNLLFSMPSYKHHLVHLSSLKTVSTYFQLKKLVMGIHSHVISLVSTRFYILNVRALELYIPLSLLPLSHLCGFCTHTPGIFCQP